MRRKPVLASVLFVIVLFALLVSTVTTASAADGRSGPNPKFRDPEAELDDSDLAAAELRRMMVLGFVQQIQDLQADPRPEAQAEARALIEQLREVVVFKGARDYAFREAGIPLGRIDPYDDGY